MNFYNKLVFILMSMSVSLLIDSLFVKIFQVYKEKNDIKKIEQRLSFNKIDYLYYRDILEGYSPAILAFCYKKDIKLDDIISPIAPSEVEFSWHIGHPILHLLQILISILSGKSALKKFKSFSLILVPSLRILTE